MLVILSYSCIFVKIFTQSIYLLVLKEALITNTRRKNDPTNFMLN